MCVVVLYRRPQLPLRLFWTLLDGYLSKVPHHTVPTVVLGDFNDNLLATPCQDQVLRMMSSKGFSQLGQVPTTDTGSLLDHIYYSGAFTSAFVDVVDVYYSDHDATFMSLPV